MQVSLWVDDPGLATSAMTVCYRAPPMSAARKPTSRRSSASKSTSQKGARKTSARSSKVTSSKKTSRKAAHKSSEAKTATKKTSAKKTTRAGKRQTAPKKTAARRKPARRRAGRLDQKAIAKIKEQLEQERHALTNEMAELEEESFQATQSEITGEVGIDEDFADAGSATFDREQALSIANNIRDLIDQVERALARIEEGSYGSCERCGRPIDSARLRALPRTLLCTDCKRREERAR